MMAKNVRVQMSDIVQFALSADDKGCPLASNERVLRSAERVWHVRKVSASGKVLLDSSDYMRTTESMMLGVTTAYAFNTSLYRSGQSLTQRSIAWCASQGMLAKRLGNAQWPRRT
jgi:hypothetical protein